MIKKIRLSHSTLDLLNTCERKFQLDRLLSGAPERRDYPTTVFGKAYGAGLCAYIMTQNIDHAIHTLWLAYEPNLEDDKRSVWVCINALINAVPQIDTFLLDWEPVTFNGKTSAELSFCLDIDDQFYYVGYLDLVVRNRYSKRNAVLEIKTTALNLTDLDPVYINSGQAVGYSIVLDAISGADNAEYDVIYIVCQIGSGNGFTPTTHIKIFPKTIMDRLHWFLGVGIDTGRIREMMKLNVFPKRGASCLKYNKPCHHLGTCGLYALDTMKPLEEDVIDYQFRYNLDDIITNHIERVK